MAELRQYELVRVVRLLRPPEHYNGWGVNERAPTVGDTGWLIEILEAPDGDVAYVVECSGPDGDTIWLDDLLAEELEPVVTAA
jgi:hypothetical protein